MLKNETVTTEQITLSRKDCKKQLSIPTKKGKTKNLVEDIQLYGTAKFQNLTPTTLFEVDSFTAKQNRQYKEALFGLKLFTNEELSKIKFSERQRIDRVHQKTKRVLNSWKNKTVNDMVDDFLLALFPHSKAVKKMVEATKDRDIKLHNNREFSELGINKLQIVKKLVEEKILPVTFLNTKLT